MARVWRDGNAAKMVYVYRLFTAGTLDEKVLQRQLAKEALGDLVGENKRSSKSKGKQMAKVNFKKEDLRRLFDLR